MTCIIVVTLPKRSGMSAAATFACLKLLRAKTYWLNPFTGKIEETEESRFLSLRTRRKD